MNQDPRRQPPTGEQPLTDQVMAQIDEFVNRDAQQSRLAFTHPTAEDPTGMTVIGEVPTEARATLNGLYWRTRAEVLRDDLSEGEPRGIVVHKGALASKDVYFVEFYAKPTAEKPGSLHVWVMDEARIKHTLDTPTATQEAKMQAQRRRADELLSQPPHRSAFSRIIRALAGGSAPKRYR